MENSDVAEDDIKYYDVFISYAREDKTLVKNFTDHIEQNGFSVCWDVRDFFPELSRSRNREIHMARSSVYLLVFSAHYKKSDWRYFLPYTKVNNDNDSGRKTSVKSLFDSKALLCVLLSQCSIPEEFSEDVFLDWTEKELRTHSWRKLLNFLSRAKKRSLVRKALIASSRQTNEIVASSKLTNEPVTPSKQTNETVASSKHNETLVSRKHPTNPLHSVAESIAYQGFEGKKKTETDSDTRIVVDCSELPIIYEHSQTTQNNNNDENNNCHSITVKNPLTEESYLTCGTSSLENGNKIDVESQSMTPNETFDDSKDEFNNEKSGTLDNGVDPTDINKCSGEKLENEMASIEVNFQNIEIENDYYNKIYPHLLSHSFTAEDEDLNKSEIDELTLKMEDMEAIIMLNTKQNNETESTNQYQAKHNSRLDVFSSQYQQMELIDNLQSIMDNLNGKFLQCNDPLKRKCYKRLLGRYNECVMLALNGKKDSLLLSSLSLYMVRSTIEESAGIPQCCCCDSLFHSERALELHFETCVLSSWKRLMNHNL